MSNADASIDFLDSIPSDVLQASGPYGQAYDLQLSRDRAQRSLDWQREALYEEIDREERQAHAMGRFGSLTPAHERVERDSRIVELKAQVESLTEQVNAVQSELGGVVFLPATDNLAKIEKTLKAYNRKASAIGTGEITLTLSDEKLVLNYEYEDYPGEGQRAHADFEHVFAVLSGATPQIPGYEFLATVVPTEHGNVVNKVPPAAYGNRHNLDSRSFEGEVEHWNSNTSAAGQALAQIDLSRFKDTGAACEHCHKDRDRKDLYVVYNETTGEALQVGRTCLRDYMGSSDPERVLAALEQYREIYRLAHSRGEREVLRTITFLTHCATLVRKGGGYERGLGQNAVHNYLDMKNDRRYRGEKLYVEPTPADEQAAADILRWVRSEWPETGEFPDKVKIALAGESVDERLYNIAGAAFAAQARWIAGAAKRQERAEREARKAELTFVGTEGQRETFTLTMTQLRWIDTAYGEKVLILMTDPEGNAVKWFTTSLPRVADKAEQRYDGPVVGGTYQVKATVKEHEDHPVYGKSTAIRNGKFEKTISEPEGTDDSQEDDD